jgi:adenylosuccinate lyase
MDIDTHVLTALSPLDGRYALKVNALRGTFSEFGLFHARVKVEIEWLKALATEDAIKELPAFDKRSIEYLDAIVEDFDITAAERIKTIERTTNHDVKAVEYYIKEQLSVHEGLSKAAEFVHFACTSEDINNLSYALMTQQGRTVLLDNLSEIFEQVKGMGKEWADVPMLSRTHGQPASPTTVGKEFINIAARLQRAINELALLPILGKINGAVGNFNAHSVTYPEVNWPELAEKFVAGLGLTYNPYTIQIEPHDSLAAILDSISMVNVILIDTARDIWGYVAIDYFKQKLVAGEVGSSTMPHKVNPIDFENAEGNLGLANAVNRFMSEKLPVSRWQRDLTDSTVLRNLGLCFGHSLVAYESMKKGLGKLELNKDRVVADLNSHPEVLAEAVQTVMRRYGIEHPYEKLKDLTRGEPLTLEILAQFINEQPLPDDVKKKLSAMKPENYTGLAQALAEQFV